MSITPPPHRHSPETSPFCLEHFPTAILHVDADAFFTSVEQAIHPRLKGRPVVTGKERGIIACASYEAKALGIRRGVSLWDARKIYPQLVVLPSDYETYSLYSKRMANILRRYTPAVEEYSIDESFADITGMRRVFHASYEDIARRIQHDLLRELDLSVSVGLSLTKSLAKLGSDFRKPRGITAIPGPHIHRFLARIPLAEVWGLGRNRVALLEKYGLRTACDFALQPDLWIRKVLGKPGYEIHHELRGRVMLAMQPSPREHRLSISKMKTFSAPSNDADFIRAKWLRNLESALIKLRRLGLETSEITVALRQKNYVQDALSARLSRPASAMHEIRPMASELYARLYRPGLSYRATLVVLSRITEQRPRQCELFEDPLQIEKINRLAKTVDAINHRFGKHKIASGLGLFLDRRPSHERDEPTWRKQHLLPGENARQRLGIPRLDISL